MGATWLDTLAARDTVREQSALIQLQQETAQLKALKQVADTRALLEHSDPWASSDPFSGGGASRASLGPAVNDLLINSAGAFHTARPGSRQHGDMPPFYRTEMDHWAIVDAARVLEALCPTACNILDVLSQFAMFTGFEYKVVSKERGQNEELVKSTQKSLDQWMKAENWFGWEVELFRRSRRDGEGLLLLITEDEPQTDIGIHLQSFEPEQLKEPQHISAINSRAGIDGRGKSWKYGILTERDDTAVPLAYWVVSQYAGDQNLGTMYEADEVYHIKTEWIDRQSKRGVSDFFSVANDIPGARKLLRSLREGGEAQAHIVWVKENLPGGMPGQMPGTEPITNRQGATVSAVQLDGPTALGVPAGTKYIGGPLGGQGSLILIDVLQAALRNIGSRWQMPEGLISGDASNANLASALVAEGPFVRALEYRQWHYRNSYARFLERVLDQAAAAGRLGPARDTLFDDLELSVECKPVIPRKQLESTQQNEILSTKGILSDQNWSAREDLDFEDEQANREEHQPLAEQMFQQESDDLAADREAGEGKGNGATPVHKEPEGERV